MVKWTEDGTLHSLVPTIPVAHAQRQDIGEWSCWFNWDKPGFPHKDPEVSTNYIGMAYGLHKNEVSTNYIAMAYGLHS